MEGEGEGEGGRERKAIENDVCDVCMCNVAQTV